MVYIHCGRFQFGSGSRELQGPDHLVDAGVILVTLNYRLGVFGESLLHNDIIIIIIIIIIIFIDVIIVQNTELSLKYKQK